MKTSIHQKLACLLPVAIISLTLTGQSAHAVLIAGVDFEGASQSSFNRNPDDLDLTDLITVSSGNATGQFDGWKLTRLSDNASFTGLLRNDAGANGAGATTPDFPARLEGGTLGSWSIFIPDGVVLDLDRIEFDVRGATGGATGTGLNSGRSFRFNTSLDGTNILASNPNLNGRNAGFGVFHHFSVDLSGSLYQGLTDQEVSFNWSTPGSGAIDLDTIRVFGTVRQAIPEPATASLGLLGLAGLMMRRRRMA